MHGTRRIYGLLLSNWSGVMCMREFHKCVLVVKHKPVLCVFHEQFGSSSTKLSSWSWSMRALCVTLHLLYYDEALWHEVLVTLLLLSVLHVSCKNTSVPAPCSLQAWYCFSLCRYVCYVLHVIRPFSTHETRQNANLSSLKRDLSPPEGGRGNYHHPMPMH